MRIGRSARAASSADRASTPPTGGTVPPLEGFAAGCSWGVSGRALGSAEASDPEPKLPSAASAVLRVLEQALDALAAARSEPLGARRETTTSSTPSTTEPPLVRAEIRYVPGPSCCRPTRPANRTRLRPGLPRTLKRPITSQTGETWVTVKKTRAARGRTKVSVVKRRARLPLIAIHVRDDSKCLTLGLRAGLAPDEPDEAVEEKDGCDVRPAVAPPAEVPPPVTLRSELAAVEVAVPEVAEVDGAEGVDVDGALTDGTEGVLGGGAGTVGAGSFGIVGSGRGGGEGTVGSVVGGGGTVTVGTGTVGVWARAVPARTPRLARKRTTAADLMPRKLPRGRKGFAVRPDTRQSR
jgi:hypothetical protein